MAHSQLKPRDIYQFDRMSDADLARSLEVEDRYHGHLMGRVAIVEKAIEAMLAEQARRAAAAKAEGAA